MTNTNSEISLKYDDRFLKDDDFLHMVLVADAHTYYTPEDVWDTLSYEKKVEIVERLDDIAALNKAIEENTGFTTLEAIEDERLNNL